MLVGPPGTGKSRLVEELLYEASLAPARLGLTMAHDGKFVTPDESWTTRELVGGETVDDHGRIRFATGAILDAIARDEWLVLDEANRADMDRIFGGVLTWLSGQSVNLGRLSGAPDAGNITLGWTGSPNSEVNGLEALQGDDTTALLSSLQGTNGDLSAPTMPSMRQHVFRFGLALGRRFAHVPIRPPSQEQFFARHWNQSLAVCMRWPKMRSGTS